jgi:polysaccharide export outer membrane protein
MNVHTSKNSVSRPGPIRFISRCIPGAFAALAAAWTPSALADASDQYRLSSGDKINLVVLGQSELSGDFTIDGDGAIQLPLTGPIKVADLTVTECRERIYKLLSDGILSKPAMAVRIGEMRPIYVLGDVRSPGTYPYRYSTTVKSALAAAGDEPAPVLQPALFGEYLQAEQRVRELQSQRWALLVRAGRFEAERQGKTTFVLPISGDVNAEMIEMFKEEGEALKASTEDRQSQIEAFQAQKARYKESLAALEAELAVVNKRVALAREKTEMYEEVERRGYGRRLAMIDASLAESSHAGDQWRLRSEIASRNAQIAEIDTRIGELQSAHRKQIRAELYEVRQRLREIDAALPTARELRDARLVLARGTPAEQAPRFSITRTRNGSTSVIQATDTTLIEPGDVIEVKRSLPFTRQLQEVKIGPRDFPHRQLVLGADALRAGNMER